MMKREGLSWVDILSNYVGDIKKDHLRLVYLAVKMINPQV